MNRLVVAACFVGVLGANALACSVTGVGDPCIPETEFSAKSGSAQPTDLTIDVNSVQCETRVCLQHYFKGRVSCPYGNGGQAGQGVKDPAAKCQAVAGKRNLFTLDGTLAGSLCCPVLGDVESKPINNPVEAQCSGRPAKDAVYCSCRCDVPDDPEIDRGQVNLCKCPDGFSCTKLCDRENGGCATLPKGKWGSYCVKDGAKGSKFNPDVGQDAVCGAPLPRPT